MRRIYGVNYNFEMKITQMSQSGVCLIEPQIYSDDRGFFMETYQAERYAAAGIEAAFVQDNHSGSRQGILRGLHYQIQRPQGKLVRVVVGEVFDVAVDLRRNAPTFGQWVGTRLSAENRLMVWIPAGFAHGFYVLSEWAEILYKTTDFYFPEGERTLLWNDPALGIEWPLIDGMPPLLSPRDQRGDLLRDAVLFD